MDGTETGWGRSAEPAPRWRALLDRARLGGRGGGAAAETDREADEPFLPPVSDPEPLPRRGGGNGYAGRARAVEPRYGADTGYRSDPGYPESNAYRSDSGYRSDAGYRAESTYPAGTGYTAEPTGRAEPTYRGDAGYRGSVDSGYRTEDDYRSVADSRRADGGYRTDRTYRQAEPGYPVEPVYRQPEPAYPESGHQAESGYRTQPAGYQSDTGYPAEGGYPTEPAYQSTLGYTPAAESTYPVEPSYPAQASYPTESTYRTEPARTESRYALLEQYRHNPFATESRHAVLDEGHREAEPSYPAPVAARASVPTVVERGYPARVEWRPQQSVESEEERAAAILRRDFGVPRVLAFANPKGGVHKTTATVLAAATVGSVRGRGVLAWDDNELRGTLGLRAGSARHARTIRHLIADLATIEISQGADLVEQLDDYLRHASDGSYDVLAGEESPRFAQKLDKYTVKRVLDLLRRTHDVICVDTGNNVESPNWRAVMTAADQLVLTTVPREDAAFSADWMLDLLHEVGMGELADNAVTLLSCPNPERSPLLDDLHRHFATRTRAVAVVPYDPALETGSSIEYHQLQPETRQAWLRAAAVMLEPFAR